MGVGAEAGWLKQPHLARVRLIGLWGWVKLHTCCILSNQYAQVKPATSTHTLGEEMSCMGRRCRAVNTVGMVNICSSYNKPHVVTLTLCVICLEEPN